MTKTVRRGHKGDKTRCHRIRSDNGEKQARESSKDAITIPGKFSDIQVCAQFLLPNQSLLCRLKCAYCQCCKRACAMFIVFWFGWWLA